jgi:hypothetical protein
MQSSMHLKMSPKRVFQWLLLASVAALSLATMAEGGAAGASNGQAQAQRVLGAQRVADRVVGLFSGMNE